jgi:hypothetical protein
MFRRIFLLLLIVCFTSSPLWAQTDPFVGQWELTKITDQMNVKKVGANTYAFDLGAGVERIVVNGTQQRAGAGTTLSVAAEGPKWKVIRKKDNRVLLTAIWSLSKDGNSLKDDFTSFAQDGSPSNVKYVYERRAPGSGFEGTWVGTTTAITPGISLQVRRYESNGLSFITPSAGRAVNVTFDGKDHPNAGVGSVSARRLNARAVEIIRKSNGKVAQTRQIELSPDLRILTMTVHMVGKDQPYIYVFKRI